jgi:hypothetical protein
MGMTQAPKKGVYKLNPTKAVMKTYTEKFVKSVTTNNAGFKKNGTASDAVRKLKGK